MFRHMRLSKEERFGRLRAELWRLCEEHLDRPLQLASDYVLARCYKHCCIIFDLEMILGQKEIEAEYYRFKDEFDNKTRKGDIKANFESVVRQVHTL